MAHRICIVLAATLLGAIAAHGANTTTTTQTLAVSVPSTCTAVALDSNLTNSCGSKCATAGNLTPNVTQRSTLTVDFSGGLLITGGSTTGGLQNDAVTDLKLLTTSNTNPSWLTAAYDGFSYTPKASKYDACGTSKGPGSDCTFAFYAIDPTSLNAAGTKGKACRFTMVVSIDAITLPAIESSHLYADFSAASMSASKASFALLALLAVPAWFLLAL